MPPMAKMNMMVMTGMMDGRVMARIFRIRPAPSISAAS